MTWGNGKKGGVGGGGAASLTMYIKGGLPPCRVEKRRKTGRRIGSGIGATSQEYLCAVLPCSSA